MKDWQPSTLSWSFSKKTHFDSCKRHYFYHRFWGQDPKLKWRLFEMRNITTLTMLRGQVVHTVVARALEAIRLDQAVNVPITKEAVTDVIRKRYQESYTRQWHIDNRPQGRKQSEITNLLEHYYKFPNVADRAREARQVAWNCVENLFASSFWEQIAALSPSKWQEVEGENFPSFDLDGILVYAKIDFAYSGDVPTIVDWKTGAAGPGDRKQLMVYSMYAQSKWGWDPLESELAAVYLQPELEVVTFTPSREEIESVREEVKSSFNDLLNIEPAFGPAKIEDFPITDDTRNCLWCRFRGVCEGAERIKS